MIIVRVVVATVLGLLLGGAVNMALIVLGSEVIPAPDGVDVSDPELIANAIHLFGPRHFVFPFLAHAGGTMCGALCAHLISGRFRNISAYVVGAVFFAGGIAAASMISAPIWFTATDLLLAYIPMAYLATLIGYRIRVRS